jgi:hypothetical protein
VKAPVPKQAETHLPLDKLLLGNLAAGLIAGAAGLCGAWALGYGLHAGGFTALGAGLTGAVSMVGTLVVRPGRTRPILQWATLLIALASGRLVVSAGACLLLYFAAQMPVAPLLVGMFLTLVIALFIDTRIAVRRFKHATPAGTVEEPDP